MKQTHIRRLLLSLFLANALCCHALPEHPTFYEKHFDQSNGLCENTVNCIIQDRLGYIWMATWDGLTRYDGEDFTLYKSTPTGQGTMLPSNRISWIVENANNDIWCIVNGKVYLFRCNTLQFEEVCPKERLLPIQQIRPQTNGRSLLMATDGIAYEVSDHSPTRVLSRKKLRLGTEAAAIYRVYTRDYVYYADGYTNIFYRNRHTGEQGTVHKIPGSSRVYKLCCYQGNRILASTDRGVFVYDSPTQHYPLPGCDSHGIKNLCIDRQGNIWAANYPGVTVLCPVRKIIAPQKADATQKEDFVRALCHDSKDRTWIADKNGFVRIAGNGNTHYLSPDGTLAEQRVPFGHHVYCIYEDSKGNIWMGTKTNGLLRLSPVGNRFSVAHYPATDEMYTLSHAAVYAITEDAQHQLWVGTFGGGINKVVTDRQGNIHFVNSRTILKGYPQQCNHVRCLYALKNGVMLVGTDNGLVTFSTREATPRFHHNRQKACAHSLVSNNVMQMGSTKEGTVWLATFGGGLHLVTSQNLLTNDLHFQQLSASEGMTSDACLTAVADDSGDLWTVSEMVISKYHQGQPIANFTIRDFGDGFIFSEAQPVCADGQILVGTTQGLLAFSPEKLTKSAFSPNIVLNRIVVEGKERRQDFNIHPALVLNKDERNVVINFSTLDFNRSVPIRYKYKVEGLDNTWKTINTPSLNLANIPPGHYTLQIASTNGDGLWNSKVRTLSVTVLPTFNETLFAKVLYSLLLVLLGVLVFLIAKYIYQLRAEIEKVQLAANEKMEKISQRIHELMGGKATLKDLHTDVADKIIDRQREFTDKLMDYMNQNIDRSELQVGDIAAHMGMSKTLLYTKTKEALGCTPLALIGDLRIKRAVQLLESGYNVSSVAYACGFSDPHYFSKCFRKAMGYSPSEHAAQKEKTGECSRTPLSD